MARSARDRFERQLQKVSDFDDADVRAALLEFGDALDPERPEPKVPKPDARGGVKKHFQPSNNTAYSYMTALRCAHERGLDLLGADAETVNDFMADLVVEPDRRRHGLVEYDGKIKESSAPNWQSALRGFYRFSDEPGRSDDRPDTTVSWEGADDIRMFNRDYKPKDPEAFPDDTDLDAMREACLQSQNTRRDRAFLELAAGTGQRATALVTLRIGDVNLDGSDRFDHPHILLNPEIAGDGDKGAIENAGRLRPIVTATGPVRQWIEHHPMQDPALRDEHGFDSFEECYLFVGDPNQRATDASDHWGVDSANSMLNRRQANTADLARADTVEVDVNPHQWRHLAYTKSQKLPIDESTRRKMFGWAPGSDTGQTLYGHADNEEVLADLADAWADTFDDADAESVRQQLVGGVFDADLPPEVKKELVQAMIDDDRFMDRLAERAEAALADD